MKRGEDMSRNPVSKLEWDTPRENCETVNISKGFGK